MNLKYLNLSLNPKSHRRISVNLGKMVNPCYTVMYAEHNQHWYLHHLLVQFDRPPFGYTRMGISKYKRKK